MRESATPVASAYATGAAPNGSPTTAAATPNAAAVCPEGKENASGFSASASNPAMAESGRARFSVRFRSWAAAAPSDVDAQILVADLDLLGGHVEDAFARLVDLVRVTSGEEREQVRAHLLELFAVVGSHDERVRKARTALMSALF